MHDVIHIRDLLLRPIIGANPEERLQPQDVLINLELHTDTRQAGLSDELADTVNYFALTQTVSALVENSRFRLVEKLAAAIAHVCLQDARVARVRVTVEKLGVVRFARSVGLTIERAQTNPPK